MLWLVGFSCLSLGTGIGWALRSVTRFVANEPLPSELDLDDQEPVVVRGSA